MTEITDERFTYRRNEEKIAAEQQLDGIYIVRSNVEPEQSPPPRCRRTAS